MADMMNDRAPSPASHYEYVMHIPGKSSTEQLKQKVFYAMDELEGWCSKQKAAVLVDLILNVQPTTVVEIGVFGGKSLIPMAYALKENENGKIYGIDPWDSLESIKGMDGVNRDWWGSVDHKQILQGLNEKITKFGLQKQVKLIKNTSEKADPIAHIDLLHIDGNHSLKTSYGDVIKWVPLVRPGGIIIFDDIGWETTGEAVQWLDAHCKKIREFKGDNVWGIWLKT